MACADTLSSLWAPALASGPVAFLLGYYAAVIEVLHAPVGLLGYCEGGLGLAQQVGGGVDNLAARAGIDFLVLGLGGAVHGLGLAELGLDYRRVYVRQGVAGMHGVALVGIKFDHAARQFARDTYCSAFYLALDVIVGAVHK